jgi:Nucleotidyl transferase AbiEii toxin, Type IV TA system
MFYLDLFGALDKVRVRYVVVGGVAMNLHGVERATMDIDLAMALDSDNLSKAIDALAALGMKPAAPISLADAKDPANLSRWRHDKKMIALALQKVDGFAPTVDILIELSVPFTQLESNSICRNVSGILIRIASIDDLIALKRAAGRDVDTADIRALETLKRIKGAP